MIKTNKNIMVPNLRFPEFRNEGDWKEKNIYRLVGLLKDGSHGTHEDSIDGECLLLSAKNIIDGQVIWDENDRRISKEEYDKIFKSYSLQEGDILLTIVGTIGRIAIYKEEYYNIAFQRSVAFLRFKNENVYFIYHLLNNSTFQSELKKRQVLSAQAGIYLGDIAKIDLQFPSNLEQQKIAGCLSSLDELITAQSKKFEALQAHKKGLLQNFFPAEGETVPLFRFPEFEDDGDWVEKTLGQVVHYENGKAHEQDIDEQGEFIVVNSKFISTEGEVKKFTNTANLLAKEGDILMVLSDVPNGRAIAKCFYVDKDNTYTVNQRICKLTTKKAVSLVLFYLINRNPYFLAFDDGVKQTNLRKDDVLNCPLLLPKNPKEQQKIADCLFSIDELIFAQSKKLEALKIHKKGLMQQLFPNTNKITNE